MRLRSVLEQQRQTLNISWEVLEQDYVLSWVLFGISGVPKLRESLVFKGGTALKKCYFGNYRFSQDLDFSSLKDAPEGKALEFLFLEACEHAQNELNTRIPNPLFTCNRYTEKRPHPQGQEAFVINAQLPWHRAPYTRVMVEITRNQLIVNPPLPKSIIHNYPEDFNCEILTYTLEEIFAEKLLAILENRKKIHERKWSRSRARDYYDLWKILQKFSNELSASTVLETLKLKCSEKEYSYQNNSDFFDSKVLMLVEKDWNEWLSPLIHPLPSYEKVIPELQSELLSFLR